MDLWSKIPFEILNALVDYHECHIRTNEQNEPLGTIFWLRFGIYVCTA